jgi:hydroxypyruvate reductase
MSAALADTLARIFRAALASLDPARLVHDALPPLPPRRSRVVVIAAGKAAAAMARGALSRWPDRVDRVLVVGPDPIAAFTDPRVRTLAASHPIPDERSVIAAEAALALAADLGAGDLLVALISGGASSLLASPAAGLSLAEKRAIVATLLDRGAPIREVNLVRRHLSRVKGGRLARAAIPARVLSLIFSDVIGGEAHDIGSGPTVPDPTTIDDARAVLRRHAPELADAAFLDESLKPDTPVTILESAPDVPATARLRARILVDPSSLAAAMRDRLELAGFSASVEGPDEGDAAAVVDRRIARAATLAPGEAVVIACEPTVQLPAVRGSGGRAGWVALAAMRRLPEGVALLCAASDGVDGSSGAAGAGVIRESAAAIANDAIDQALATFDDAKIHRALGTHLQGGPTGHNLADLHVLARSRS